MSRLLCLDFDETITKVSYFKKLRFEENLPGLQAAEIQTPQDVIAIKQAVTELLDNPETGLKNADELAILIKDALRHGDCVAITSYNDYPEAIDLALARLNLSPSERASIYLSCHLPFYGVDGERLHFRQAEFADSRGKDLHIQEALRYFQNKGKQIDAIVLLDDNNHSIDIVALPMIWNTPL